MLLKNMHTIRYLAFKSFKLVGRPGQEGWRTGESNLAKAVKQFTANASLMTCPLRKCSVKPNLELIKLVKMDRPAHPADQPADRAPSNKRE